jgi:LysM repeat protein
MWKMDPYSDEGSVVESSSAENMMNNRFIHFCAFCILFSLVSGCSRTSTPPAKVTIPDKQLLLEIARLAIAKRLPDVAYENLEPRCFAYRWYIDELNRYTNDSFSVDFRVKNSKKRVDDIGGSLFKIETVEVDVGNDGQIGKGGVSRGTETFRSEDLRASSGFSAQGEPVLGTPFYPLKLKSPPPCPSRRDLVEISLRAIRRFLPRVKTDDLVLRSASYTDMNCPEQQAVYAGFNTTFGLGSSVHTNITQHEVIIEQEEITVTISTNGQVTARGVPKARGGRRYNRDALPPPLGSLPEATEIQTESTAPRTNSGSNPVYYVVEARDDLESIAMMFGISLGELKKANGLAKTSVKVGQLLRIPHPDNEKAEPAE